eukprot:TRINITY_DN21640_c0_g1_i1.p1 TRINITY_DN21640_c0_g1~~TRINITY_DN21640_c0_g1_i1.p1  ORF type:complete len:271 (+),score=69.49 TRINITY_DN21640_c0_g1_i1:31-813(+)
MSARLTLEQISGIISSLTQTSTARLTWIRPLADFPLKRRVLAVLDSSFNPPTRAHLTLLSDSLRFLNNTSCDDNSIVQGVLMHSVVNADKKTVTGASLEQRVEMLLQIQSLDQCSIALTNKPLFVDKAQLLREELGDARVYMIIGEDTLVRVLDEKYYKGAIESALTELFGLIDLICFARATSSSEARSVEELEKFIQDNEWGLKFADHIHILKMEDRFVESLSSTSVREAFVQHNQKLLLDMIPKEVIDYCVEHRVYTG